PDAKNVYVQTTLLFISALFYVSLYLLGDSLARSAAHCKKLPLHGRAVDPYRNFNFGLFAMFYALGLSVILIYFTWDLYLIAEISIAIYAITLVAGTRLVIRPFLGRLKRVGAQ
ncbi:MAG: hypothetical protein LUP94_03965, partial [Candidatus Methanomethylicus sp.]|nr:hypothetical protein [Candidatus Methanomethylicus sp.]